MLKKIETILPSNYPTHMFSPATLQTFLDAGTLLSTGARLLIGWGPRTFYPEQPSHHIPTFYFPDFFLSPNNGWFSHEQTLLIDNSQFLEILSPPPPFTSLPWKNGGQPFFFDVMDELKQLFASKELTKAVPFAFATCDQPLSASILHRSLFHALRYTMAHPGHLYGCWDKGEGILGVTPEVLFTLKQDETGWNLSTAALAGTVPAGQQLTHPKLLEEHRLVVEGICESLAPFGIPEVAALQTLVLPHLSHLKTPICMKLTQRSSYEALVRAIHPTPALGAFPRSAGERWLCHYQERHPRYRFGAPVGYQHPALENSHCYVAIRNVQWFAHQMLIGAGCGVVAASDPQEEWSEIELKIKAIKDMLSL